MTRTTAPGHNERSLPKADSAGGHLPGIEQQPRQGNGETRGNEFFQRERRPSRNETYYLVCRGENHSIQPTTSNRVTTIRFEALPHKALISQALWLLSSLAGSGETHSHLRHSPARFRSAWVSAAFRRKPVPIDER